MREISVNTKLRVIKLFFAGLVFDEIAKQLGIAKGSVVNIIDEFRNGKLPIPPGMTEYVDELRRLVVDLKKHNATIQQLQGYLKLHAKLKELGADIDKALEWLDVCQGIAASAVSDSRFIKSALELERFTSQTGMSYESLVNDYKTKLAKLKNIERNIEEKSEGLGRLTYKYKTEQEQARKILDSISKAIETAQASFKKQKEVLQSELEGYLANSKLSWEMIKEVEAMIDFGLTDAGLSQIEKRNLRKMIRHTGSALIVAKEFRQEKDRLKFEVDRLVGERDTHQKAVKELQCSEATVVGSIEAMTQKRDELDRELQTDTLHAENLSQEISRRVSDIYICHLIMDFLFNTEQVSNEDIDRLASMMMTLRQQRLAIKPRMVGVEAIIYKHEFPRIYTELKAQNIDIDSVKMAFAFLLTPLVKDQMVSKYDYDTLKSGYEVVREGKKTIFRRFSHKAADNNPGVVVLTLPP